MNYPFVRIGGRLPIKSVPFFFTPCHIQTDGAFSKKRAAIATLLKTSDGSRLLKKTAAIVAESSTETEWASVCSRNQEITQRALKREYVKHYINQITEICRKHRMDRSTIGTS